MQRILIIQTASVGDVILSAAVAESLHLEYPGAIIDFLTKKGNEDLFRGHPFIRQVLIWDKKKRKYQNLLSLIRHIRTEGYDLVVNIQRFLSSGIITLFSGAKETRGFKKNPLGRFFTRSFPHQIGTGIHEIHRNHILIADLVKCSGSPPALYPSAEDIQWARSRCRTKGCTISPASLWHTKQYPAGKWAELINRIPHDTRIFLLGSASDRDLCEVINRLSSHPGIHILAGELSYLRSAALMKQCTMNYTNDSAPMHLASAVNAPVTAVFCSTVTSFGFGPLSEDSAVVEIRIPLSCRPCGLHGKKSCPEGHFRCALDISTEELICRIPHIAP